MKKKVKKLKMKELKIRSKNMTLAISSSKPPPSTSLKSQFLRWAWRETCQDKAQLLKELKNSRHNIPEWNSCNSSSTLASWFWGLWWFLGSAWALFLSFSPPFCSWEVLEGDFEEVQSLRWEKTDSLAFSLYLKHI